MSRAIVFILCFSIATTQRSGNFVKERGDDHREIQRQNKITQQIITNFLERRLFPYRRPQQKVPSVDEILQSATDPPPRERDQQDDDDDKVSRDEGDIDSDIESLQSVESEQIDSFYRDEGNQPDKSKLPAIVLDEHLFDCPNCVDDTPSRWTMPLTKLGDKRYYLGIFFKANWFKAAQYCRYHGMHLASISSQEENDKLEKYVKDFGLGHEHFWTSGTDLADEGTFFWMATGRPITFTNWNAGEPNNFRYENGEEENCMELWNRDGKGLKWNDSPCSFETYFICEVQ